jgi:hypothetical protein
MAGVVDELPSRSIDDVGVLGMLADVGSDGRALSSVTNLCP